MSLRLLSSGVVALSLALLLGSTALAQPFNPRAMQQQQQQRMQPIKTGGSLVAVGQNQIQISTNTNQTIYVMIGPDTEVSVTGSAEQSYLKSGVNVEFVGEVDKTHTVKDKVLKMLIVSPSTERPVGLFAPEFATPEKKGGKGGKEDPFGAGPPAKGRKAGGNGDIDPLGGDPLASKPAPKARGGAAQFPGTFTVRGAIKMCKEGKITIATGHGPSIKAEVDGGVAIDVDMSDLRAVQPDDRVSVDGFASQARPNLVMAKSVKITLANPLTGAKKHAARTSKTPPVKAKKEAASGDDLLSPGK